VMRMARLLHQVYIDAKGKRLSGGSAWSAYSKESGKGRSNGGVRKRKPKAAGGGRRRKGGGGGRGRGRKA